MAQHPTVAAHHHYADLNQRHYGPLTTTEHLTTALPPAVLDAADTFTAENPHLVTPWTTTTVPLPGNCDTLSTEFASHCVALGLDAAPILGRSNMGQGFHAVTCVHHEGRHLHVDFTGRQFGLEAHEVESDDDPLFTPSIPCPLLWDVAVGQEMHLDAWYEWSDRGVGEGGTLDLVAAGYLD